MKGWIRKTWMGCVVALALGVPVAHADGGRIRFVGAIVEPTCSIGDQSLKDLNRSSTDRADTAASCAHGAEHPQVRSYALHVQGIADSGLAADRVLAYFSQYLQAEGHDPVDTRLVTQSYL